VPWLIENQRLPHSSWEGTTRSAPQHQYNDYDDNDDNYCANTDINWLFLSLWCTSRELP
jgi:hypothetical protein